MRIKAKKTNSASENAIRSSYFVIQSRKLMHLSRSTLINETNDSSSAHVTMDVSTQKIKISTNHISDKRPCLLGYSKQSHRKTRLLLP